MSFAAEEVKQRAYVRVLSARKVRIGTRRKLVAALKDAVANKDGYELLSDREIKSALGRKWWNFKRCKDTGCILEHAPEAGIDRLILITLSQDPNGLTLDLEVDDAYSREALKVTSITTDDPNSNTQTFAAEAIEELLTVKKDDPPPPPAPQAKPIELIEGDPDAEMRDDEPFAIAPVWSYSTIGLGVAMLGAGGVFGLRAGNTQTEIQSEPHSRDDLDALIAQGESDQSLANTFYIAGGVVTTLGVAMLLFLGPDEDPSGAAARQRDPDAPRATPDPVRVHLGLTGVQLEVDFGL